MIILLRKIKAYEVSNCLEQRSSQSHCSIMKHKCCVIIIIVARIKMRIASSQQRCSIIQTILLRLGTYIGICKKWRRLVIDFRKGAFFMNDDILYFVQQVLNYPDDHVQKKKFQIMEREKNSFHNYLDQGNNYLQVKKVPEL